MILVIISSLFIGCSQDVLDSFLNELTLPTTTKEDLELPISYSYKSKEIITSWFSSNQSALSNDGTIKRLKTDQEVILVVTASYNNQEKKKTFKITILADVDEETINAAINKMMMPKSVSKDISLPSTKTENGETITITWSSNNPEVLANDGKVNTQYKDTIVILTGTFKLNNAIVKKEYEITVQKNEMYTPELYYHTVDVYSGNIVGEHLPEDMKEFQGALYRKVQSSRDYWLGIEVVVTLPEFIGDEGRTGQNTLNGVTYTRYLDNASVYLGGNIVNECDIGLTWSIGSKDAQCSAVDYTKSIAYRPFWRYITSDKKNIYKNAKWEDTMYYYYPGDKVRMSVFVSSDDNMKLRIELLEETTIPKYVEKRNSYNLGTNYNKVFLSPSFEAEGAGRYISVFKRVCALDQANNEAKPTQPTNAQSLNTIWHEVYLYREINNVVYKVPMTTIRRSEICAPSSTNSLGDFTGAFKISYDEVNGNLGGEKVSIIPNNRK